MLFFDKSDIKTIAPNTRKQSTPSSVYDQENGLFMSNRNSYAMNINCTNKNYETYDNKSKLSKLTKSKTEKHINSVNNYYRNSMETQKNTNLNSVQTQSKAVQFTNEGF